MSQEACCFELETAENLLPSNGCGEPRNDSNTEGHTHDKIRNLKIKRFDPGYGQLCKVVGSLATFSESLRVSQPEELDYRKELRSISLGLKCF